MDKNYQKLFQQVSLAASTTAEQVIELNKKNQDEKGEKTAQIMLNDYNRLYDILNDENFDYKSLNKNDYAKLLVATIIVTNNLTDRIKLEEKVLRDYKINVLPKLQRIVDEATNDLEAANLSNELFITSEKT